MIIYPRKLVMLFGYLLIIMIFTGCSFSHKNTISTSLPTINPPVPIITGNSTTPTNTIIHTKQPSITQTSEFNLIPPTLIPTLTSDERADYFVKSLRYNSNCLLPCWWRVIPNQTNWVETLNFLNNLGVTIVDSPVSKGMVYHGIGGFDLQNMSIYNSISFIDIKGIIVSIIIQSEGYHNLEIFNSIWEDYSLDKIMTTYGQPTRVWVQSFSSPHETPYEDHMPYSLWVFYDNTDFLIKYTGSTKYESVYNICPQIMTNGNVGGLDIAIKSPSDQTALEYIAGRMGSPNSIKTIEEATGSNIEKFYHLFVDETGSECFEAPRDIFP